MVYGHFERSYKMGATERDLRLLEIKKRKKFSNVLDNSWRVLHGSLTYSIPFAH